MPTKAAYEQHLQDEEAEQQCQDHDAIRASASRNLEPEFMEVAGHRVFTTPYGNVYALVEEMAAIENLTPDQQRLKVILESTTLQIQAAKSTSQANPSGGPEARALAYYRLGPQGNQVPSHSHLGA